MEAFSPSVAGLAGSIASRLLPALRLLGPALQIYSAIKLVGDAWDLGNQKLAEYVELSQKAVSLGVSTEFYQRIAEAAKDAKAPVDLLTGAVQKLNDATADQLGGTAAQNRFSDLTKAGNFKGNTGVSQFADADTAEAKFRAITNLIDQAMQKGERLAALDVAKTFLGDQVASNLAKDSDYLNKMIAAADKVKAGDLVSQASVDNAVALQSRLDAAEQILSQRWHPLQDLLVQGGIAMKEAWVNIVENIAAAVDWAGRLIGKLGEAPSWFVQRLNEGATAFVNATTTPESRKAAENAYGITSDPAEMAMLAARQRLSSALPNSANIDAARDQANAISNKMRPDKSGDPKTIDDTAGAYDRATESLLKYIATTNAAAESVGKSVAEQERAKAAAQLLAAAEKDGTTVTAEMRAEIDKLADRAAAAAQALEKAKIAADIKFNRDTALLSSDDVQIATQLKGLYPDVATALGSVEAQSIRTNTAMKGLASSIESSLTSDLTDLVSGSKSAGQAFSDMSATIVKAIEQMIIKITIVEPLMRSLQSAIGGSGLNIGSLLGIGSGGGLPGTAGSAFFGPVAPSAHGNVFAGGNIVPFANGGIPDIVSSPTIAPMALFGEAGEEAIVPLHRGSDGKLGVASSGGRGRAGNVTVNVINAPAGVESQQTTTDGQGNQRIDIVLNKKVDSAVGDSLVNGSGRRVLASNFGVKPYTGS
jgi:hypothetical protein